MKPIDTHYKWRYQQQLYHKYAVILICEAVMPGLDVNLKDIFDISSCKRHADPISCCQCLQCLWFFVMVSKYLFFVLSSVKLFAEIFDFLYVLVRLLLFCFYFLFLKKLLRKNIRRLIWRFLIVNFAKKSFFYRFSGKFLWVSNSGNIYLLKVNNRNTRKSLQYV